MPVGVIQNMAEFERAVRALVPVCIAFISRTAELAGSPDAPLSTMLDGISKEFPEIKYHYINVDWEGAYMAHVLEIETAPSCAIYHKRNLMEVLEDAKFHETRDFVQKWAARTRSVQSCAKHIMDRK